MNKLEALNYLVDNGYHGNEWQGAGMYTQCQKVIKSDKDYFTKSELDEMLAFAKDY